jgi:G:T/U-mismatch repair DNA glycosylase
MNFFYPNFQNDMWRIMGLIFYDDPLHFVIGKKFDEEKVRKFCHEKGIAIFDTAQAVIRQNNNASDKFLEIIKPVDLASILTKIPDCNKIAVTGQKSAEILMSVLEANKDFQKPLFLPSPGTCLSFQFKERPLWLYRMPSTSMAYPKPLQEKAEMYSALFREKNLP